MANEGTASNCLNGAVRKPDVDTPVALAAVRAKGVSRPAAFYADEEFRSNEKSHPSAKTPGCKVRLGVPRPKRRRQ